MKRLLCILSNMNAGGAETFLMKIYRNIYTSKYQMDFIVSIEEDGFYDNEIKNRGGKIFHITPKSKNPIKSFLQIVDIVKKNKYKYVLRIGEHSLATIDLLAAKIGGADVLAIRTSNSKSAGSKIGYILHTIFKPLAIHISNIKIAPSTEAALYTFGKKQVKKNNVILLKNAIPYKDFIFNNDIRKKTRENLNISNKIVIGHIGRFNEQKNHKFLIEIFKEFKNEYEDSILMLVGTGILENDIKKQVEKYGLEESVIFLGTRSDIPNLLMAMDLFVFPSLYEGMPNTVIEAQATGLTCIISDTITKEANITGLVKYVSLDQSSKHWKKIMEENIKDNDRPDQSNNFIKEGYDIQDVADEFIEIIFNKRENK